MQQPNIVGPEQSWRLVHDGEQVIFIEELVGYTETLYYIFEGPTRQSCMVEVYRLGLEMPPRIPVEPTPPTE